MVMKIKINEDFIESYLYFLNGLKKENDYGYYPVKNGATYEGKNIELGFSCFAIKSLYIIDEWKNITEIQKNNWLNFINEFQNNVNKNFSEGSFIDINYLENATKFSPIKETKRNIKKLLYGNSNVKSKKEEIQEFIRAETKQAISTLYQVGSKNSNKYHDKVFVENNITNYLKSLNWSKPWNAGAQFSALCVFLESQEKQNKLYIEMKKELVSFSNNIIDTETGCYFKNNIPEKTELINGAMKVLTGLDWLGEPVHKPDRLIDTCLTIKPQGYGCDIVDIVYVLYRCSKYSDYKKLEINLFFEDVEELIYNHYFPEKGGFSYYVGKSQLYYYGLNITEGAEEPDIHGSTLLIWALSMIYDFREKSNVKFNILKP
tara:strand:- start:1949 stop:3073 length:1125 start_codon:yes stop_codon:yes gene_type:complete